MTGRRGLAIPAIAAAAVVSVLIGLGFWQLARKAWKENLIATVDAQLAAPPAPLPPAAEWLRLRPLDEFRRMTLRVEFVADSEGRVYGGASGVRPDIKALGYSAFAPAHLADGSRVVINRGHVDNPSPDASLRPIAVPRGPVDVVGALRWPEASGLFVTAYSARQDLWFVRDQRAMARHYGWGEVAPFYVDMEAPPPSGGVPKPGPLKVTLRNDHLGYALTWFGLAIAFAGAFGFWLRSRARERG